MSNKIYPIGIDVLQEVFQRCGTVHKIVTFTSKTGGFQAFIQYSNVSEAQEAMKQLNNQNIYSNCCTLSIQYSDLDDVNVKFNNEKTRDFTNPDLPTVAPPTIQKDSRNFGNPSFRGGMGQSYGRGGIQGSFGFNQPFGGQVSPGYNPYGTQGGFNQPYGNQGGFNQGYGQGFNQPSGYAPHPSSYNQQFNQSTVLHVTHLNPEVIFFETISDFGEIFQTFFLMVRNVLQMFCLRFLACMAMSRESK